MSSSSSSSSSSASVRISSDLAMGSQCLRHSAALRIVDNHLHTTDFLPRSYREPSKMASNMDKYCVGQAVTTYRQPKLLDLLHDAENQLRVQSHVWLAKVGGGSSLTFGSAVTLSGTTLTTCSRVFVRVDAQTRRPIRITEEERMSKYFVGEDCDGRERFGHAIPEVSQITFGSNKPDRSEAGEEVMTVQVGPQHMNHGDHVDHAFLADTASHALYFADPKAGAELLMKADQSTLTVQYLAAGQLGQELKCHVTKDENDNNIASIWGQNDTGEMQLLTLAQWSKR